MDTKEHIELQKQISDGASEMDQGPYYHESWWESYKGGVKGKFGGAVIGAALGATVGILAAAALAFATGGFSLLLVGGFAAGGMVYGATEFSEVGKVTGAVAAAHEKSEERMKSFEEGKFAALSKEINDLKSMIAGKPVSLTTPSAASSQASFPDTANDHYTQHCDDLHCAPQDRKLVFWNIAVIGLVVGMAAGALLAVGGGAGLILGALGHTAAAAMSTASIYAVSMTTMGLFGASFGINRDVFREIFDKTDRLFKGILTDGKNSTTSVSQAQQPSLYNDRTVEKTDPPINTVIYDNFTDDYPQSDTYHRDKVLASAKQALLSMDHTKAIPH